MNIVIDTNVIISAILSQNGKPYKILNLIGHNESVKVYYSTDILAEYKRVLSYARLNINVQTQMDIINTIKQFGILIESSASTLSMPDESDRIFYDTAKASDAILITGNIKHFPAEPLIMTPSDFLNNINETLS